MGIRQPLPLAISSAVMSVSSSATLFFLVEQQCDLNPQGRFSFCQSDAGMWRYENQVEFPFVFQIFLWGQSYTSLLGKWENVLRKWHKFLGKWLKLLVKWCNFVGETKQIVGEVKKICWGSDTKSVGRCPKYKVTPPPLGIYSCQPGQIKNWSEKLIF